MENLVGQIQAWHRSEGKEAPEGVPAAAPWATAGKDEEPEEAGKPGSAANRAQMEAMAVPRSTGRACGLLDGLVPNTRGATDSRGADQYNWHASGWICSHVLGVPADLRARRLSFFAVKSSLAH